MAFLDCIRLLFVSDRAFCRELKRILGFCPRHTGYYRQALEHSSVRHQVGDFSGQDNERLEYLGDAILGAVAASILYERFPKKHEGFLTNARSKMVRRATLNKLAHAIGLDGLIHSTVGPTSHNCSIPGNALEAFVGAIYLDRGYAYCYRFIEQKLFGEHFDIEHFVSEETNFKSHLLEWCQKQQYPITFTIESEKQQPDGTVFWCVVNVFDVVAGRGKGYSKKESHQQAARDALQHIRRHDVVYNDILAAVERAAEPAPEEQPVAEPSAAELAAVPSEPDELL